jgi:hypothetical protein
MKVKKISFGSINIDGKDYFKDIVIHKGKIKKRKKKGETWKELDKLHLFGKALRDDSTRGRGRSKQR